MTCPHSNPELDHDPDGAPILVCPDCGQSLSPEEVERSQLPIERSGFAHVPWPPEGGLQRRPYTPDEIELEIMDVLSRIERGSIFLTQKERERGEAKLTYEINYARTLAHATGKSEKVREAQALVACEQMYDRWQTAELACRVSREALHNLRAKLSGLQSVASSIRASLEGTR